MKTQFIPLIGEPRENLYQLGLKERESFQLLEQRVNGLLSTHHILRYGHGLISKAKAIFKKKENTFFDDCVQAYAEGLGIEASDYHHFISLFELAAHYGQNYPELLGLLPGCTTVFEKSSEGLIHNRLIDFPLIDLFNARPRLYYWKIKGERSILNYSCEGLAPLFFQAIHDNGIGLSLHHKPGMNYHKDGQSIFKIIFNSFFSSQNMSEFKRELRKKVSITKWGLYLMESSGQVMALDIDGPALNIESFDLNESSPLIFTNIPLNHDALGFENFIQFSQSREFWLKQKFNRKKNLHTLDLLTDVKDQQIRHWHHCASTLSTVAAFQFNFSTGCVHIKEGDGALTLSDAIYEFSLQSEGSVRTNLIKNEGQPSTFELAWKQASLAQSLFDQGEWPKAYHHLQMAHSLMPHPHWKEILLFYIHVWNFKFISNKKELAMIYRELKKLSPPDILRDQWYFLCMRFEKRLGLVLTIDPSRLSAHLKDSFIKEIEAPLPIFNTWMKFLYPRLEILNIFSPHHR